MLTLVIADQQRFWMEGFWGGGRGGFAMGQSMENIWGWQDLGSLGAWPIRFAGRKKEARGGEAFPQACLVSFGGLGLDFSTDQAWMVH